MRHQSPIISKLKPSRTIKTDTEIKYIIFFLDTNIFVQLYEFVFLILSVLQDFNILSRY